MPPKGKTTVNKAAWLNVFSLAITFRGADTGQDQIIRWVEANASLWSHLGVKMPADSTCKAYIRELKAASDQSWLDVPWSVGYFYSYQPVKQITSNERLPNLPAQLIPYERLPNILRMWRGMVIGEIAMTCRQAVWMARLQDFFEPGPDTDVQLYWTSIMYASCERAAVTSGIEFDSTALDAELAFIRLPASKPDSHAYRRALKMARHAGELPPEQKFAVEEAPAMSLISTAVLNDMTFLIASEQVPEVKSEIIKHNSNLLVNLEPWKSELYYITWRAIGGREMTQDLARRYNILVLAGQLRQTIADEDWPAYDALTEELIKSPDDDR
jgi:hypothetical protein